VAGVSFKASEKFKHATAGLHMNLSLFDDSGHNQFYQNHTHNVDKQSENFTELANRCARKLLLLQKEGLSLYAPNPNSYKRFGKHSNSPTFFHISHDNDSNSSLALRSELNIDPKSYRIEDRLAGADADPYLVLLAGVGALWDMATHPGKAPDIPGEPERVYAGGDPKQIRERSRRVFSQSTQWRDIVGRELQDMITRYYQPRHVEETLGAGGRG